MGQENTARIKLKNKLSKRLFPINVIDGKLYEGENIYYNQNEVGKILINHKYPFALIKFNFKDFNSDIIFNGEKSLFKILIPNWLKI